MPAVLQPGGREVILDTGWPVNKDADSRLIQILGHVSFFDKREHGDIDLAVQVDDIGAEKTDFPALEGAHVFDVRQIALHKPCCDGIPVPGTAVVDGVNCQNRKQAA